MKRIFRGLWLPLLLAIAPVGAHAADSYPSRAVKMVVPFNAGGATDVVARLLAKSLGQMWGQSVIVDNRAGAGGNIGAEVVARSSPDGYTLLMASGSIVTANEFIYKKMPFSPEKDLVPITNVATGPQVIAVGPTVKAKTLQEFIAYAKANPGKVNFGSAGVGTQVHLAGENFANAAGIDITHVPYKGEAAAMTDLMGGQIQMVPANLGGAINFIREGKMRALAVTSPKRSAELPDVPAVAEVLPGFDNEGWFGLLAPAGTPKEVIEKIARDTAKAVHSDEFRKALEKQGMTPVGNTPEEFDRAIVAERAHWQKVVHERHLAAH